MPANSRGCVRITRHSYDGPGTDRVARTRGAGAFRETQLRWAHGVAAVVAGMLALAVGRAEQAHLVGGLRAALATRAVIDQALGIVMARRQCTSDEAFAILREASQNRNIKLRDVAAGVVMGVSGRRG